jgi:glycosyltransferase involved in cell wall biosynthesis
MRLGLVSHVYPAPSASGSIPGIFIAPFGQAVAARGYSVWVLAPGTPAGASEEDGLEVHRFQAPAPKGGLGTLQARRPLDALRLLGFLSRSAWALDHLLSQGKTEALLAYWAFPAGFLCRWAARRHRVPYAIWALGSDIYQAARVPGLRQMIAWGLRGAKARYANGRALCRAVEDLAGASCGFLPVARPLPEPQLPSLTGRVKHILFAGRLEAIKGPDVLLQAAARLVDSGLDFHLWMVGDGSLRRQLQETIAATDLAGHVSLEGYVSDARLAGYLQTADLLVVPSRSESMPLVVTEAARFGTPVVVTDVGDLGPLVRQHGAGLVVPPERPDLLAAAMRQALTRPEAVDAAPGLAALAEMYSLDTAVARFLDDITTWSPAPPVPQ